MSDHPLGATQALSGYRPGPTPQDPGELQSLYIVFTDIVESTKLKRTLGDHLGVECIQRHHALLRSILKGFDGGEEIETAGDSFLLSFATPDQAVHFALSLQRQLILFSKESGRVIADRVGIHLGHVFVRRNKDSLKPKDLFGIHVDTCARVMSLAQPRQILMTSGVFDAARPVVEAMAFPDERLVWLNHGLYSLKGIDEPVQICEVGQPSWAPLHPPDNSEKVHRKAPDSSEPVFSWRPGLRQTIPRTAWILQKKLGEGGFGEVWLAAQDSPSEQRVFKFCFRVDRVRSLKREVTLFTILNQRIGGHPNIVRLLDVNFDDPPYNIQMEYVAGADLRTWCQQSGGILNVPLPVRIDIVIKVAEALQAAHDAGVIHRDIKPGNILITGDPLSKTGLQVKITDFGIGQIIALDPTNAFKGPGFTETIFSESYSNIGTQLYMAPELLAGGQASVRADIYSLGVVLYQLLAGDFNQPVTTDWQLLVKDELLREDLERCFAGNPADRFESAGEFGKALITLEKRRVELAQSQAQLRAKERAAYRLGIMRASAVAMVVVLIIAGLALVARRAAKQEAAQRRVAQERLYVSDCNLIEAALDEGNLIRAFELLQTHKLHQGQPDLRGFEWRFFWRRAQEAENLILRGHAGQVTRLDFSPAGRYLASCAADGLINIWDLDTHKQFASLHGHALWVNAVAFSPNGECLASASDDKTVKLWAWKTGKLLCTLTNHSGMVLSLVFSPDGRRLASAGESVRLWDVNNGRQISNFSGHMGEVWAVAFSPNGKFLISGGRDGRLLVWDAGGLKPVAGSVMRHSAMITSISVSPDSAELASGSNDGTIKVWTLRSGNLITTITNHSAAISAVAFSSDGKVIYSTSADRTLKVSNAHTGAEIRSFTGTAAGLYSLALSPRQPLVATGQGDGTIKLWPLLERDSQNTLQFPGEDIRTLDFSPDSAHLLSCGNESTFVTHKILRIFDVRDSKDSTVVDRWTNSSSSLRQYASWSPDNSKCVCFGGAGVLRIWDAQSKRLATSIQTGISKGAGAAFAPDGSTIAVWGQSAKVELYHSSSGALMSTASVPGSMAALEWVAFSPDTSRMAVLGYRTDKVFIFDTSSGTLRLQLPGHKPWTRGAAFSPDGSSLATCGEDQLVKLWDIASGRQIMSLKGHVGSVNSVAFCPDGKVIASAGGDNTIRLWSAPLKAELATITWPPGPGNYLGVLSVTFAPNGNWLAASSQDKVRFWQAASFDN